MDLQEHNQLYLQRNNKFTESTDNTKLHCPHCNASMEDSFICDSCGYYAIMANTWPNVRKEFFDYNKEWFQENEIIL